MTPAENMMEHANHSVASTHSEKDVNDDVKRNRKNDVKKEKKNYVDNDATSRRISRLRIIVTTVILLSLLAAYSSMTVVAIEVPKGIDGHIYALDGVTPVPDITNLYVINTNTNETITMHPGLGEPGRYSLSLDWNNGDNITIRAANPQHQSDRNITLDGIIHNFDLYLNTTLNNIAPNITSEPELYTTRGENYTYQIIAYDWNYDPLAYSLTVHPDGMIIDNNGLIQWSPDNATGNFIVTINVSDGIESTLQEYQLFVEDVNIPPVLTTTTYDMSSGRAQLLTYDQNSDYVTATLLSGPVGFLILPNGSMSYDDLSPGAFDIVVGMTDNFVVVNATAHIVKYATSSDDNTNGGSGGGSGRGGGRGDGFFASSQSNISTGSKSTTAPVANTAITFLDRAPNGVRPLDSVVLKYVNVSSDNTSVVIYQLDAKILTLNAAKTTDVVVYKYDAGTWKETPSSVDLMTLRVGVVNGVYAIALKTQPIPQTPTIVSIPEPTIITGWVLRSDGKPYGPATIKALYHNEEILTTETSGPYNSTFHFVLNNMRGKTIEIVSYDHKFSGKVSVIALSNNDVTIVMTRDIKTKNIIASILLVVITASIAAFFMHHKMKKGKTKEKVKERIYDRTNERTK